MTLHGVVESFAQVELLNFHSLLRPRAVYVCKGRYGSQDTIHASHLPLLNPRIRMAAWVLLPTTTPSETAMSCPEISYSPL